MEPLDFQKPALTEIVARARAYFAFHKGPYRKMVIQPRWPTILVAPTGVGKTTTAKMVASDPAVRASILRIAAPSYIPCGAHNRGARETISVIAEHVALNHRTLLVIDELDKISDQENPWQGYIRNEWFDQLGGTFPTGLTLPDLDDGPNLTIDELNEKLRTTVFFLGIGTFQEWFDSERTRRTIGFGGADQVKDEITADIIAQKLPRELVNRFGKIVRMPELQEKDYRQIAQEAEGKLPEAMREIFREEVSQRIQEAIEAKKGVRFIEEALTAVLINLPEPAPSKYLTLDDL
ncbi:MAG: AAA family ATPase [Verrucomicrobia bacterium]|nr:MAG: AAA family ATPase [Verrucomicrobiota bacterium]